jgi:hypothetical protein
MKSRKAATITAVLLGAGAFASSAGAEPPANPSCWGVVTAQRASTEHDVGTHSSAQDEPRSGLGNVARALTAGGHLSDLGTFLASVDELEATSCP